jgi:hypothetical protein
LRCFVDPRLKMTNPRNQAMVAVGVFLLDRVCGYDIAYDSRRSSTYCAGPGDYGIFVHFVLCI